MRKDVIDGVLDMYGYEEEILDHNKAAKVRYLVMKSLRNKKFSPWRDAAEDKNHP